jgi:NADH:ubiquinone oxidoreductase subunit 6 (subunit J)
MLKKPKARRVVTNMDFSFNPDLKLYVLLADVAFIAFIAMTLLGAIVAVGAKQLIHAVLGLVLSLAGVAGLYVYLGNHFIAAMQILIYVGAVSISMVFAVMLARPPTEAKQKPLIMATKIAPAAIVALFGGFTVGRAVLAHDWVAAKTITSQGTMVEIGTNLLTKNVLVFELISLVLLVAIMGSVIVAKRGRGTAGGDI